MSNVSIYEKNWIDLVFEDKNKAYGAYQLRQENQKTTLFAFFGGILFLFSLLGGWMLFSSFGEKPAVVPVDPGIIIKVTDFNIPKSDPIKPKSEKPQTATAPTTTNKFKKYEAAVTHDTNIDVPKKDDLTAQTTTTASGIDTGTKIDIPSDGGGGTTPAVTTPSSDPVSSAILDRLPEYPGGMKRFNGDVGKNFEKPDVDSNYESLSVIMSFVIEKDGSMTEIKVLRSSDKNMEREAIRVLKSMRAKWSPGYKDGEKVRVLYTLPIKVAL